MNIPDVFRTDKCRFCYCDNRGGTEFLCRPCCVWTVFFHRKVLCISCSEGLPHPEGIGELTCTPRTYHFLLILYKRRI